MRLLPPQVRISAKAGNRPEECEDAQRVSYPIARRSGPGRSNVVARVAIADGATEAAFSSEWASILTEQFIRSPLDLDYLGSPAAAQAGLSDLAQIRQWLASGRGQWHDKVPWDRLPWHGEAKARAGALATLACLTFSTPAGRSGSLSWQLLAIGDCCLFQVREDRLELAFPMEDAAQFNNNPQLICSVAENDRLQAQFLQRYRGDCQPGDTYILATDAVAQWFLAQAAEGEKPWDTLAGIGKEEWEGFLTSQREQRLMRNDDATVVTLRVI